LTVSVYRSWACPAEDSLRTKILTQRAANTKRTSTAMLLFTVFPQWYGTESSLCHIEQGDSLSMAGIIAPVDVLINILRYTQETNFSSAIVKKINPRYGKAESL
jgi:hypothetical protein